MARLKWTEQATNDLKNIFDFISNDSKHYAFLYISKIRNKCSILKSYPLIGRVVPEFDLHNVRELIMGNYRIIYKIVDNNQIDILSIFHSSRNLNDTTI